MTGCAICVYDLYEDSLQSYDDSVEALQKNLRAQDVPESEWPESIRPDGKSGSNNSGGGGGKSPTLSAFEELERKLQAKQQ